MSTEVKRISPMIAVEDVQVSIDFYTLFLGFSAISQTDSYSVIERDGATIHLMKAADQSVLDAVRGHTDIYIEVTDVDIVWNQITKHELTTKAKEPFNQPYGMREFHLEDPDGFLLFVGSRVEQ